MNLKENLGKSIQKYRKLNNLTQEKLTEIVEIENLFNFSEKTTCEDFEKEILSNLSLLKNDKTKLGAINSFIKSILTI